MFNRKFIIAVNGLTLAMMAILSFQLSKTITTTQFNTALFQKTAKSNSELIQKNNNLISKNNALVADLKKIEDNSKILEQYSKDHKTTIKMLKEISAHIEKLTPKP
jgi:predicted phage tail protein